MKKLPSLEQTPNEPGAYALVLTLARAVSIPGPRRSGVRLDPGTYLYCGSAWGPGGLRARIARHAKRNKTLHWHVDHLRKRGALRAVIAIEGGRECGLVDRALGEPGVEVPVPGFGSTDCRQCSSHLLRIPDGFDAALAYRDISDAWIWQK